MRFAGEPVAFAPRLGIWVFQLIHLMLFGWLFVLFGWRSQKNSHSRQTGRKMASVRSLNKSSILNATAWQSNFRLRLQLGPKSPSSEPPPFPSPQRCPMPHATWQQAANTQSARHFSLFLCPWKLQRAKWDWENAFFLSAEKWLFFLFLAFATAMIRIKAQQREKVIDALKPKMC